MASDLQTPFSDAVAPTPDGSVSGGAQVSGGYDLADGRKETANMSGLPPLPQTYDVGAGNPGTNAQITMPPVASPGTIPTDAPKE